MLVFMLLVWSIFQQVADGRYVERDDFTQLAAEVAALRAECHDFISRVTELETKLIADEAKITDLEEGLAFTEDKLAENKLIADEAKITDLEEMLAFTEDKLAETKLIADEAKITVLEERLAFTEDKLAENKLIADEAKITDLEERLAFTEDKLAETKFITDEAKLTVLEEKLAVTGRKLAGTEERMAVIEAELIGKEGKFAVIENKHVETDEKLRFTAVKLNDALARIHELEKMPESRQDEETVQNIQPLDEGHPHSSNVTTEADVKSSSNGIIRQRSIEAEGRARFRTKRFVPIIAQNVAFSLSLQTTLTHLGNDHLIKFDTVILNEGNGFDTVLGAFICPVSGVYMFQSAIMVSPNTDIQIELVKDGAMLVRVFAAGTGNYNQGFNSAITSCSKGEHVWVRLWGTRGSAVYGDQFSSFSGYLLWEV